MKNQNFCLKPFNSLNLSTDGTLSPCCAFQINESTFKGEKNYNLKTHSIDDYWNSDYLKNVQQQFLDSKQPVECRKCWRDEREGVKSLREHTNTHYKILGNKKPQFYLDFFEKTNLKHPEDYNLDITNLCNLKCFMCDGGSSSKLLIENNDLGLDDRNQKDYNIENDKVDYLIDQIVKNNVTVVTLQGGEPLLNPKILILIDKLSKKNADKIHLWITTNGTQYSPFLLQKLRKFKEVKIIFSVDGTEKVNDYMRFPSQWKNVKQNIKNFLTLKNASFQISFTVQNLNLLDVDNIIKFANSHKVHCKLNILHGPTYLQFFVLPKNLLQLAYEKIKQISTEHYALTTNLKFLKDSIIEHIKADNDQSEQIEMLKDIMQKRDAYRKIRMKDFLPELANQLNI